MHFDYSHCCVKVQTTLKYNLREGLNGLSVLPESLMSATKSYIFFNSWSRQNKLWNKHCRGNCSKIAEMVYNHRLAHETHNPKETIKTSVVTFLLLVSHLHIYRGISLTCHLHFYIYFTYKWEKVIKIFAHRIWRESYGRGLQKMYGNAYYKNMDSKNLHHFSPHFL